MPIFGQVWLWSSLAFLLGALLCWLLVARPARNRVGELEIQLATRARPRAPERPEPARFRDEAEFTRSLVPGMGDDSDQPRSYGLRDTPPMPPERDRFAEPNRDFAPLPADPYAQSNAPQAQETELVDPPRTAAATQYLDVSSGSLTAPPEVPPMSPPPSDRGWFDDELHGDAANKAPEEQPAVPRNRHQLVEEESYESFDARLVDDVAESDIGSALDGEPRSAIEDDSGGTVFTQRTHPIPGELIRQIDEAGKAEQAEAETPADTPEESHSDDGFPNDNLGFPNDNLVDDLADDPAEPEVDRRERTVESEPVAPPAAAEPEYAEQEAAPPELPQEQTEIVAAVTDTDAPEKPASELPRRVPQQNRIAPQAGVAVRVEPTPNALPKRVPGKPRHQVPFGVMPGSTQESEPEPAPAVDEAPEPARSLFEPIIPAEDEGAVTPPPPHRLRQGGGGGRGPFGPGSAMPLPGGASPSPEFTIKASVAALRYCTPESPQFGRTVAEVWFRTAADAERVGFRPVG
jgi:hypothetical protein